jgi:hypothetical protein
VSDRGERRREHGIDDGGEDSKASGGKKRPLPAADPTATADADVSDGADASCGMPKRARRSSRAQAAARRDTSRQMSMAAAAAQRAAAAATRAKARADKVKIGPDHQADVPAAPSLPSSEEVAQPGEHHQQRSPRGAPLGVESKLAFTCGPGGDRAVDAYLTAVNLCLVRRDGFPLSPMNEELALVAYTEQGGRLEDARRVAMQRIPRVVQFPGAGAAWLKDELCLLARTLSEQKRDFMHISRHVLPHRTTRELVVHYYTRHKQEWMQFGGRKQGLMFDRGLEAPPRISMGPELQVDCLHNLAVTAGDGFPPERRMRDALLSARETMIAAVAQRRADAAAASRRAEAARLLD